MHIFRNKCPFTHLSCLLNVLTPKQLRKNHIFLGECCSCSRARQWSLAWYYVTLLGVVYQAFEVFACQFHQGGSRLSCFFFVLEERFGALNSYTIKSPRTLQIIEFASNPGLRTMLILRSRYLELTKNA